MTIQYQTYLWATQGDCTQSPASLSSSPPDYTEVEQHGKAAEDVIREIQRTELRKIDGLEPKGHVAYTGDAQPENI